MRYRILTSIVIWALLGIILLFGGAWGGKWLLLILAGLAQIEATSLLNKISQRHQHSWQNNFFLPIATVLILGGFLFSDSPQYPLSAGLLLILLTQTTPKHPLSLLTGLGLMGIVCIGFGALAAIAALPAHNSLWLVVWVIAAVKLSDANACLFGKHFGHTRINTTISPLKSYEGLFGAIIAGILIGFVGAPLFEQTMTGYWTGPVLGALLAIIGSGGDLAESALKRAAVVKDSAGIIPSLGGILDLTDSLLLAAPVAWIVLRVILPV